MGFAWVLEKETYQKDMQTIMGISFFGYALTWLLYFVLNGVYVWGVMVLILKFGVVSNEEFRYADGYGFADVAGLYFLYTLTTIGFIMLISTLFRKAKVAAQAMVFLQLILNFLYFLRFSDDFRQNRTLLLLSSIFPQISFNFGLSKIAFISRFNDFDIDFYYSDAVTSLGLCAIGYTLLAFYLEQVLPNEYGTNKHPLFFINWIWRSKKLQKPESLLSEIEEDDDTFYYQHRTGTQVPMIKLQEVSKKFGDKVAVNRVTMNFYGN